VTITARTKVLVIDDDVEVAGLVKVWLEKHDFEVTIALDGASGLRLLYQLRPDLVVLDVAMPRMDGWEVCRRIRELDDVPIIMLTAKAEMTSRVRGFDLGADDYVIKPFELPELLARVRAILRRVRAFRAEDEADQVFREGDLIVNLAAHQVTVAGRAVDLSPTEFRLLAFLIQNRGRVVSHSQILTNVWGPEYRDQVAYVKLYIRYLREKVELDPSSPRLITTERGFGYRFAGPPSSSLMPPSESPDGGVTDVSASGRHRVGT
jgi:DNA-binding response OmpR family regulator